MARGRKPTRWEMRWSAHLQRLRQTANLTQAQLARKARVSLGAVRQWEAGTRTATLEMGEKLANALGVSMDELINRRWPPPSRGRRPAAPPAPPPS